MSKKKGEGRTRHVLDLCDQVLALDPAERDAMLDNACAGDEHLRASVHSVLLAIDGAGDFLNALPMTAPDDAEDPQRIGRYDIVEKIGEGGMGAVYLAERREDDIVQRVAIKTIRPHLLARELISRFQAERKILAGLSHPYIAGLIDAGVSADGMPYLVLEYVDGEPIDEYCDRHALTVGERLELVRQVAMAVQAAHQNLVVHRDIKPSNVLITEDGIPNLLDFGIAKLLNINASMTSGEAHIFGDQALTPDYASPEQVLEGRVTTASDVYSLGVLTYKLVAGEPPNHFESSSQRELSHAIDHVIVPSPSARLAALPEQERRDVAKNRGTTPQRLTRSLHGDLDAILLKTLDRDPERRYKSVAAFSDDLRRFVTGMPVEARGDSIRYRFRRFVSRNRLGVAGGAAALVMLLAALGVSVWAYLRAESARAEAAARFDQVRAIATTMMFDVYDDIEKVPGTFSARETLAATAQQYLENLAASGRAPADVKFDAARGYARLGRIYNRQAVADPANRETAKAAHTTALSIFEALLPEHPQPAAVYAELGKLRARLASDMIYVDNEPAQAREELDRALVAFAEAERLRPGDLDIVVERILAQRRYGDSYKWQNDYAEAEAQLMPLLVEIAALREGAEQDKRLIKLHADVGTLLAEVRFFDDRLEPAIEGYTGALALYRQALEAGGPDRRISDAMVIAYWSLGNALAAADRPEEAVGNQDAALAIIGVQLARDPDDTNASRRLTIIKAAKAEALAQLGRVDESLALMMDTNRWFEQQAEKDAGTPSVHRSVAVNYQMTADILAGAGRGEQACAWWRRTLGKWQSIDQSFGISDFDAPEIGKLEKLLSGC